MCALPFTPTPADRPVTTYANGLGAESGGPVPERRSSTGYEATLRPALERSDALDDAIDRRLGRVLRSI